MRFRLLGPLEVIGEDGQPIAFAGEKERILLATLVLGANQLVSVDRLVDAIWGDDPPATAANTLQAHISRLRKKLSGAGAPETPASAPGGYVLHARPDEVDWVRFEKLVRTAPDGPEQTTARLNEALALWRGPALADVDSDALRPESVRLEELRLQALEQRVEAELALGHHTHVIAELEALVRTEPLRESPRRQLMIALYRSGRQADALAAYREARHILAEDLGVDPGPALQALELAILNQDPALDTPRTVNAADPAGSRSPTGTVTFLMSDIEGSTQLWEAYPELMAVVLRRHDELLRETIERNEGHVVKTKGDGFHAAFSAAGQAVEAATAAQQLLCNEEWPAPITVRVRMAIHSGQCEERDGDYFGPTVNRVARLETIAHGGQVLVSGTCAELLNDSFPEQTVSLRDLGVHRLKDLGRPEHVFQLVVPGLEIDFPPLRSLDTYELTNNLPVQVTSFVGRRREMEVVGALVETNRLVTLTGAGGAGKTRLALAVAAELLDGSEDGVWFVDLAPLSDLESVPAEVATALGLRDEPGRPIEETLLSALRQRRLLLILDNCEHLVEPCVHLVNAILRSCPEVQILATSREALGLSGERRYRVPPLSLPDQGEEDVRTSEAISLFVERVHDQGHELVLDDRTMPVVAEICRRLDGMPLAIELACARLRTMALDDIAERLDQRFRLLTGGDRALPRQKTLRALIDWSYGLLAEPERIVLERLSVFAGDFDLMAAEVVGATEVVDVLEIADILGSLVDKSLVSTDGEAVGLRYRLLETIRQYAAERLAERKPGAAASASLAHARHFLTLVEEGAPHLRAHGQVDWLDRLDTEHDNLRVALDRLLSSPDVDDELPLRFAVALADFWLIRHVREGIDQLEAVLIRVDPEKNQALRAQAIARLARLNPGQASGLWTRVEEVLANSLLLPTPELRAELLLTLVWPAYEQRDFAKLDAITREALQLAHSSQSPYLIGRAHEKRGMVLSNTSPIENRREAREHFAAAVEWLGLAGDRSEECIARANQAALEVIEGNYVAGKEGWEAVLAIAMELRDEKEIPAALMELAMVSLLLDEVATARQRLEESLHRTERIGLWREAPYLFLLFGVCRAREGADLEAALLLGASQQMFKDAAITCEDVEDELRGIEVDRLRRSMGHSFDSAFSGGGRLSIAEARDLALRTTDLQHR
jgi:predicted ATPase/class 3 adenylate cyclase/DNA-binding winged helix-turn-helix (wHTH) protein